MNRTPIPLSKRRGDIAFILFFIINILFITYIVDIEQLVIPDAAKFRYPIWPPGPMVDLVHWYGNTFDPVLIARPVWWKTTIWIDVVLFGPYYLAAIYAFTRGRDWIRIPSIIYSSMLFTNVWIILSEERFGPHAAYNWPVVLMLNLPWLLFPVFIIARMWRSPYPFTEEAQALARRPSDAVIPQTTQTNE